MTISLETATFRSKWMREREPRFSNEIHDDWTEIVRHTTRFDRNKNVSIETIGQTEVTLRSSDRYEFDLQSIRSSIDSISKIWSYRIYFDPTTINFENPKPYIRFLYKRTKSFVPSHAFTEANGKKISQQLSYFIYHSLHVSISSLFGKCTFFTISQW